MNLTARAVRQLQTLDACQSATLLDALERRPPAAGTTIVAVDLNG